MKIRPLVAELIGTFILVGFGSLSVVGANGIGVPPILLVPFGFGFALLAGIALFGHVSGAHFNPAVTLAALLDRRIDAVGAIGYAIAQLIGAVLASMSILVLFGKQFVDFTRNEPSGLNDFQTFGVETVLAAVFVAVILTVTARSPKQAVFVIPITLLMIHFVAAPITGASVNPVRSLAPAIIAGNYAHLWVYLTAPFLGGIVGWGLYSLMSDPDADDGVDEDDDRDLDRDVDDDFLDDEEPLPSR